LVRRIQRDSGYVPWSEVIGIDWDGRVLSATGALRPLEHS
jgi:hypothetical protein